MFYVRWKAGEPRRGREFPPLPAGHPGVEMLCPECEKLISTVRPSVLVAVGPDDEESQERHDAGRWYSAGATLLHKRCADSLTEEGLAHLCAQLILINPTEAG